MRDGVIFEVTKGHLQRGLREIPVGYSSTSYVDPKKGIFYVGKPLSDLVACNPLEVIYLLMHGRKGADSEVLSFAEEIEKRETCSQEFLQELAQMPKKVEPLAFFSMALQLLGAFENRGDLKEDCFNIIAKLPHLVANIIALYEGSEKPISMQRDLGYVENFIDMLSLSSQQREGFAELLSLLQVLFLDEEGGAVDIFVAKSVASAQVDLYKSLSAAMTAFSGSLAAMASLLSLEWIQRIEQETKGVPTKENVIRIIQTKLEKKELLYGFGHPSFFIEDPRATILYDFAKSHAPDHPLIKIALLLREEVPTILSTFYPRINNPFANVYAIAGALLQAIGFAKSRYYPLLFALSRSIGVVIQILHETSKTPLVHPHYFYRLR